jgi:Na+-transporting methylmalonyl-CoA/oxaloacetate decarboxylase beta subunit
MIEKRSQANRLRMRTLGLVGAAAFVTLGAVSLGYEHDSSAGIDLAGSGDAPANTVYVQPKDAAMTMGATATWTAPATVEATAKAVPAGDGG